jgi:hypothetical protein
MGFLIIKDFIARIFYFNLKLKKMSQNQQIINYLKRFSDTTFPVAKQRERTIFQRNVEMVFGSTSSLMNMGEATSSPSLGSLVFWEDANGTEHCGIAVAKNGFKVYSITQQKGLTQMPQGVRAMEARELLEENTNLSIPQLIDNQLGDSLYGRVYDNLMKNSTTFKNTIESYLKQKIKGANFFTLTITNEDVAGSAMKLGSTNKEIMHEDLYGNILGGVAKIIMYRLPELQKGENNTIFRLNDLGRALSLVHEGIHANLFLKSNRMMTENQELEHNEMAKKERNTIKIVLKNFRDYSEDTQIMGIFDEQIDLISWYGLTATLEGMKFTSIYSLRNYLATINPNPTIATAEAADRLILQRYIDDTNIGSFTSFRQIPQSDRDILAKYLDKINLDIENIIYSPV